MLFATLRLIVPTRDGSSWLVQKLSEISKFDNVFVTMSPDTKAMQAIRKSLAQQKTAPAVASACKASPKGKAKEKANAAPISSGVLSVAPVAAASLVEDTVDLGGAREQAHVIVCGARLEKQSVLPREDSLASHSCYQRC